MHAPFRDDIVQYQSNQGRQLYRTAALPG